MNVYYGNKKVEGIDIIMSIIKTRLKILCLLSVLLTFSSFAHIRNEIPLTLNQVWQKVVNCNPGLKGTSYSIAAAKGDFIQASLVPNPSLSFLTENWGGNTSTQQARDQEEPQSTLMLSQPIELGGKRSLRMHTASHKYRASELGYDAERGRIFLQTVQLFLAVAESDAKRHLAQQAVLLNQETVSTIQKRTTAGRASELELKAAKVALADQVLTMKTVRQQNETVRYALASLWGGCIDEVPGVSLFGFDCDHLPELACLMGDLHHNPQLQALKQQICVTRSEISLSQANGVPDLNAGIGVRHFNQTNDTAYVAQVSVPLPIFDRNQGNTTKARAQYYRALQEWQNRENSLKNELFETYQIASQAELQVRALRNAIIPQARKALTLARQGYLQGRFSYLDLLNSQQKLLDEQAHYLSSLFTFRKAWISLQVLTGNLPPRACCQKETI